MSLKGKFKGLGQKNLKKNLLSRNDETFRQKMDGGQFG
jgi:hypothetical protein